MEAILAVLAAGFLLGLAGSLHCACMCGGIASGALFLLAPETPRQRMAQLLIVQAGRIPTYALAGAAAAGIASIAIDPAGASASFRVLQWGGAAVLMWVGLATANLLPRLALPAGGGALLTTIVGSALGPLRRHSRLGPFALGFSWGLTPCPMVYAALFSAGLSGSTSLGALWMIGFGAGTLPGVITSALGVSALSRLKSGSVANMAGGLIVAAFGFSTLYFGWPLSSLLCLPR